MNHFTRSLIVFSLITLLSSIAAADVVATLSTGKTVRGDFIEPVEDGSWVEIRIERDGIRISRIVPVSAVTDLQVDGKAVDPSTLDGVRGSVPVDGNARPNKFINAVFSASAATVSPTLPPADCPVVEFLPTRAVIVGVRRDPLDAYADIVEHAYPHGVPLNETAPALDLMRAKRAQQVFSGPGFQAGTVSNSRKGGNNNSVVFTQDRSRQIRTIYAEAYPISNRGKVDWDSLAVVLTAVDEFGQPVPVQGTLDATLWGQRQSLVQLNPNQFLLDYPGRRARIVESERGRITRVATWTKQVSPYAAQTTADGGTERLILPLYQPFPDHDLSLFPVGNLHVKLTVPGSGVFETTTDAIPLSHAGIVRNENQLQFGRRFFPGEGTFGSQRRSNIRFRPSPFSLPGSIRLPGFQSLQNVVPTPAQFDAGVKDGVPFTVTSGFAADQFPAP